MKKFLILLLAFLLIFALVSCGDEETGSTATESEPIVESETSDEIPVETEVTPFHEWKPETGMRYGETDCYDSPLDGNHRCNFCGVNNATACADADNDHICDDCRVTFSACADNNKDHRCDVCSRTLSYCEDNNGDHECDICKAPCGTHQNGWYSHICDYCGKPASECADEDTDHYCDVCGDRLSECFDSPNDGDHICDFGDSWKDITSCSDDDNDGDHKCDDCGANYVSVCFDAADDGDHDCDDCATPNVTACEEGDTINHKCDDCGNELSGLCEDHPYDKDHICDTIGCGKTVSTCADSGKGTCIDCGMPMNSAI